MLHVKSLEQVESKIVEAYRMSLENRGIKYTVYVDHDSKAPYIFEQVSGGNFEPEAAWKGEDGYICDFDYGGWAPEDGDDCFLVNLLSYTSLTKEQQKELLEIGEEDGDALDEFLEKNECSDMAKYVRSRFPEAYEEYCVNIINDSVDSFRNDCLPDYMQDLEEI